MKPEVPSWLACTSTVPLARAVTRPLTVASAIAGLLITYWVPVICAEMLRVEPLP